MHSCWIKATVIWLVFMTCLSHQPGQQTAKASRTLARKLNPVLPGSSTDRTDVLLRKSAHVVLFAGLALLASVTLAEAGGALPAPGLCGALLAWCWGDEATKRFVPGRHFSWLDVGLNAAGTLLGSGAALLVIYIQNA